MKKRYLTSDEALAVAYADQMQRFIYRFTRDIVLLRFALQQDEATAIKAAAAFLNKKLVQYEIEGCLYDKKSNRALSKVISVTGKLSRQIILRPKL